MANLNRIILVGRLVADPEVRTTMDATPISKFSLAVERYNVPGMPKESDFFDIVAWRKLAEVSSSFLSKGQLVLVEGRIQNRTFETKEGNKRYVTEIIASNITAIEKGKGKTSMPEAAQAPAEEIPDTDSNFLDDDLPF